MAASRSSVSADLGNCENLLYFCRRSNARPPVQQAQPVDVHRPDRYLRRLSRAAERLRHRTCVLCDVPCYRVPAFRRFRHHRPCVRRLLRRGHGHADHQAARCRTICLLGTYLGGRVRQGLPADAYADRSRLRRHDRRRCRQGLALESPCRGYRYRVRYAV